MKPVLHSPDQITRPNTIAGPEVDGCWEWQGPRDRNGYGVTHWWDVDHRQRNTTAHRLAYILARGPIPEGMTIDHLCRNRGCVNPDHLEAVTQAENVARGTANGADTMRTRRATGMCPRGHSEWNEANQCVGCIRERNQRDRALIRAAYQRLGLTRRQYYAQFGHALAVAATIAKGDTHAV